MKFVNTWHGAPSLRPAPPRASQRPTERAPARPSQMPTRPAPPLTSRQATEPDDEAHPHHGPVATPVSPRLGVLLGFAGSIVLGVVVATQAMPWLFDHLDASAGEPRAFAAGRPSTVAPRSEPTSAASREPSIAPVRTAPEVRRQHAPRSTPAVGAVPSRVSSVETDERSIPAASSVARTSASGRTNRRSTASDQLSLRARALARPQTDREREGAPLEERGIGAVAPRGPARPLEADVVRRVISADHHRLRQCYTTAMRRHGTATDAHVRMTIHIDIEGYVSAIEMDGPEFGGITACLRRTALRWRFPASSTGGRIPIPLAFRALVP